METIQTSLDYQMRENPMGETRKDALRLNFDHKLKLEFMKGRVVKVCTKTAIGRKARHKNHVLVQIFNKVTLKVEFLDSSR